MYSVVHALLLAPLHYFDAERVVQIYARHPRLGTAGLAPATFADLAANTHAFATLAVRNFTYVNLTQSGPPQQAQSGRVSAHYFAVLGVAPILGRVWTDEETRTGAAPVVILGQQLWEQRYGGDHGLIGSTIVIDDIPHTVLGVMPASFRDLDRSVALWQPAPTDAAATASRTGGLGVIGRLADGISLDQAHAELAALSRMLEEARPDIYQDWAFETQDLRTRFVGNVRQGLWLLFGAVGCVLLITCANVAGLCLVRAAARRREFAVRAALGASRGRMMRQLLAEALLLCGAGGIIGVLLGHTGLTALLASLPAGWLPLAEEIQLNLPVVVGALALTALVTIAVGIAPAWAATRIDGREALSEGSRGSTSPALRRTWTALVTVEVALATLLLAGAGILGRSLLAVQVREPGLHDPAHVLSLTLAVSPRRYDTNEKRATFFANVQREVAALTGVRFADFTQTAPFRWGSRATFAPVGEEALAAGDGLSCYYDSVGIDYFRAVGVPLLAGRSFTADDHATTAPVLILSASAARRYFGTESAVGRRLTNGSNFEAEVVGVVGDVRREGLTADTPLQVYRPLAQRPQGLATLMVRTEADPATVAKSVQAAIWRVDPDLPVSDVMSMDQAIAASLLQPRLHAGFLGLFAAFAIVLTTVGLHGVVAYGVGQRTREFGIRGALGARPQAISRLVLGEAVRPVTAGLALGVGATFIETRALQSVLYETSARDPIVLAGVVFMLAMITLLAGWLPARRAAKVEPIVALRAE